MLTLDHSIGGDGSWDHASEHLDLDAAARLEIDGQVRVGQVAPGGKAVPAAAQPADHLAVPVHGLATVDGHIILPAHHPRAQPPPDPGAAGGQQLLAAVAPWLLEPDP